MLRRPNAQLAPGIPSTPNESGHSQLVGVLTSPEPGGALHGFCAVEERLWHEMAVDLFRGLCRSMAEPTRDRKKAIPRPESATKHAYASEHEFWATSSVQLTGPTLLSAASTSASRHCGNPATGPRREKRVTPLPARNQGNDNLHKVRRQVDRPLARAGLCRSNIEVVVAVTFPSLADPHGRQLGIKSTSATVTAVPSPKRVPVMTRNCLKSL